MRFFHLADVHLGAVPDKGTAWSDERARGIYESFYQVLETARLEQVDGVFICGDLFHRQPLLRELKEVSYHFARCAPVRIFIIAGNHDPVTERSNYVNYSWPDNVIFFKGDACARTYISEWNCYIYGLSYHDREIIRSLYANLRPDLFGAAAPDSTHILLAHGGDSRHIPVHFNELENAGFDYIAFGHIHRPWLAKSGRIAYSGALEPVDKEDEGPHGYMEGEVTAKGVRVRFVPQATWTYVNLNVEINGQMSWEEIKDRAKQLMDRAVKPGRKAVFKVTIIGTRDMDMVWDLDELYRLGQVIQVTDASEYDIDIERLYSQNKDNLLGRFIERAKDLDMDEDMKKKVLYYGIRSLYDTGDR